VLESLYVASGEPFAGLPLQSILIVFAINFIAFLARGAIGIGAVAVTVAVSAWVMPAQHAVLLTLLAATLPQIPLMREGLRDSDWHVSRPLLIGLTISIVFGVWGFARLSSDWFGLVLGITLTLLVLLDVSGIIERFVPRLNLRSIWVAFGLALVAGLLAGLSGAGGLVLLSVYLRHACRTHQAIRGTAIMIGSMILIWRTIVTLFTGLLTLQLLTESLLLLPAVYGGVVVGRRFFRGLSPRGFNYLLQGALLASALGLTIDGLLRLVAVR
jgi:uncharacterized membrane protein YfcA